MTDERRQIGRGLRRPNARPQLSGRGRFIDDLSLPGMLHVAFVRSPLAHARILHIDKQAALAMPGVVAVIDGRELAEYCRPWTAKLTNLPPMQTVPEYALPPERVCWQGEPVAAVVADSRALAEDAAEQVEVDWRELPVVADIDTALAEDAPLVHADLGTNVAWRMEIEQGDPEAAFAQADVVVERVFEVGRQTGVTLEARGLIAEFNHADGTLNLQHSTQVPHIYRYVYAKQLGLRENRVRIICPDVGGGFGLKLHIYSDEIATAAIALMLRRPVKFIADRLEAFVSDIHARGHRISARVGVNNDGRLTALALQDVAGGGAYLIHPRTSTIEPLLVATCTPLAYSIDNYRAEVSLVYQNKVPTGQYRGVGMPIASLIAEGMADAAAQAIGMDKAEFRRRNLRPDDAYPCESVSGVHLEGLSQQAALARVLDMSDYDGLRAEQAALRKRGVYRGVGLATVVEGTSPSPELYAAGGAPISSRDGCTLRLEADGGFTCITGLTEQGQGSYSVIAQVVADALGVELEDVRVVMGDTAVTPFGGGTWASRGTSIAGESALQAARLMRRRILEAAAALGDVAIELLRLDGESIIEAETGRCLMTLEELGHATHFHTTRFPKDFEPDLLVTQHYSQREHMMLYANCAVCVSLDVDIDTGAVILHKVWVAEDCGKVINPLLVDEQIRGGAVQGIGSALYEECIYDEDGQLRNGSLVDYLVPMAAEMPDFEIAHLETPTGVTELGAKGCGEAGMIAMPPAIMNAINDALEPLNVSITAMPFTPARILQALHGWDR